MGSFTDNSKTSIGMAIRSLKLLKNPSGVRLAHKAMYIPEHPHTYCPVHVVIFEWKISKKLAVRDFENNFWKKEGAGI